MPRKLPRYSVKISWRESLIMPSVLEMVSSSISTKFGEEHFHMSCRRGSISQILGTPFAGILLQLFHHSAHDISFREHLHDEISGVE